MSTPSRPRVLNNYGGTGTPRRTPAAVPRTPNQALRTTSIKDQIRALRQAAATPPAGTPRARERREAVRQLVRKAADTGRLVLPPHIPGSADGSAPLTHLPIALYTLLLGIPAAELSRKPPASSATKSAASPFPAAARARNGSSSLDDTLDALSLVDADEDDVFGERQEEEAVGGFIGGRDLEVLKVAGQALETLDLELGLFGGMRALDVRDNKLEKLPSSLPHLGLLTTLTLSHNNFSEFPTLLALLPSLAHLDLSDNQLTTLEFTLPTRAPMFPESFASPPPAPDTPAVPFPVLRTLLLEHNALELARLPPDGWPASLDALHLQGNPLFPTRGGGLRELDLESYFRGAELLRHLGLEGTGVASLALSGRTSRHSLQVVNLSSNPGLIVAGLDLDWSSHPEGAQLCAKESGEAHSGRIELVLDAHLLPNANSGRPKRHVYVPPSPEDGRTTGTALPRPADAAEVDQDPFWSSKARDTAASSARRNGGAELPTAASSHSVSSTTSGSRLTKPLATFDDWDPPATSSLRSATPSRTSTYSPCAEGSADAGSIFSTSYSASSQSFQLSAASKTPLPSLPGGAFSVSTLLAQPYASNLRAVALSGRQIRSFSDVPSSGSFAALEELSITQCPVHLTPLAPALPLLFPALQIFDVSESSVADALFANATIMRALLLDVGVRVIRARESGVRSLKGLEEVAQEVKDGTRGDWRCEEIDLQDNLIEQLPSIVGFLPLRKLLVDRNLFRSPNRRVWERDGTAGLLAWLREST